jgi:hypothetical protein
MKGGVLAKGEVPSRKRVTERGGGGVECVVVRKWGSMRIGISASGIDGCKGA